MEERAPTSPNTGGLRTAAAWGVHVFTGSGVVLALLALLAVEDREFGLALLWLLIALAIDGVDGSLARWARVKERAARIDGDTLDLVVDYLTYVFIPTLFILRAELVPPSLALLLAALIQYSSLYLFARTDMKTDDGYFRGFPALWNLVAFYLFVTQPGQAAGAGIVLLFVVLTFAPVHFVHPFRVRDYGKMLPALSVLWALATVALLWPGWSAGVRTALLFVSGATGLLLIALGLIRTLRDYSRRARA